MRKKVCIKQPKKSQLFVNLLRQNLYPICLILATLILSNYTSYRFGLETGWKNYEIAETQATIDSLVSGITYCESRDVHNRTSHKGAYGRAQFMDYTFAWMKKLSGMTSLEWRNEQDQLKLLRWAVVNGYGSHWQTCYRQSVKLRENELFISSISRAKEEGMVTNLFGTTPVDKTLEVFNNAIRSLRDRAEAMKKEIKLEEDYINEAKKRQEDFIQEGLRAERIAKKLEDILV